MTTTVARWRRQPLGQRPALSGIDVQRARVVVDRALTEGRDWPSYADTATILEAYGINLVSTLTASTAIVAVAAANRLGYPVVLKSADPELVHKTDTGGVRLGLTGPDEVREAFAAVTAAGRPGTGVLVQPQLTKPVELVAGIAHDHQFGSIVLLGLGGVHTDALEDLMLRLGRLAEDLPEVAELDLNPVLPGPTGVVAKLRLAPVDAEPDPMLRRFSTKHTS